MYNNPMYYNNFFPYQNGLREGGNLIKRGLGFYGLRKINWSNILNNTQKTLNVINQAIPVYYQVKPIWGNAKTMFRMIGALKDDSKNSNITPNTTNNIEEKNTNPNGPVFFI